MCQEVDPSHTNHSYLQIKHFCYVSSILSLHCLSLRHKVWRRYRGGIPVSAILFPYNKNPQQNLGLFDSSHYHMVYSIARSSISKGFIMYAHPKHYYNVLRTHELLS